MPSRFTACLWKAARRSPASMKPVTRKRRSQADEVFSRNDFLIFRGFRGSLRGCRSALMTGPEPGASRRGASERRHRSASGLLPARERIEAWTEWLAIELSGHREPTRPVDEVPPNFRLRATGGRPAVGPILARRVFAAERLRPRVLLGRPIGNRESQPSCRGLSSSAGGPEAALIVVAAVGASGLQ